MIDGVCVQLSEATESSVRVTLVASGDVELTGAWELYGPRREYGRTLASTFRNRATSDGSVEFLVTEPGATGRRRCRFSMSCGALTR